MTPIAPNPTAQFGDTVTLKAVVEPSAAGAVTFRVNGRPTAGVAARVSGGVAQATLKLDDSVIPNGAGSYPLTATFVPAAPLCPSDEPAATVTVAREGRQLTASRTGRAGSTTPGPVRRGRDGPCLAANLLQSRRPMVTPSPSTSQARRQRNDHPLPGGLPRRCLRRRRVDIPRPRSTPPGASPSTPKTVGGRRLPRRRLRCDQPLRPAAGRDLDLGRRVRRHHYINGGGTVNPDATSNANPRRLFAFTPTSRAPPSWGASAMSTGCAST